MLCSCSINILSRWWLHNDMTMSSICTVYTVCTSWAGEGVPPASIWQLIFEHPHDRNGYYLALDRTASCSVQASTIAWWRRRRSHEEDSWWITSQRRGGRAVVPGLLCLTYHTITRRRVWLDLTFMPTFYSNDRNLEISHHIYFTLFVPTFKKYTFLTRGPPALESGMCPIHKAQIYSFLAQKESEMTYLRQIFFTVKQHWWPSDDVVD